MFRSIKFEENASSVKQQRSGFSQENVLLSKLGDLIQRLEQKAKETKAELNGTYSTLAISSLTQEAKTAICDSQVKIIKSKHNNQLYLCYARKNGKIALGGYVDIVAQVSPEAIISTDSIVFGKSKIYGHIKLGEKTVIIDSDISTKGISFNHISNSKIENSTILFAKAISNSTIKSSTILSSGIKSSTIDNTRVEGVNSEVVGSFVKNGNILNSAILHYRILGSSVKESYLFNKKGEKDNIGNYPAIGQNSAIFKCKIFGFVSVFNSIVNQSILEPIQSRKAVSSGTDAMPKPDLLSGKDVKKNVLIITGSKIDNCHLCKPQILAPNIILNSVNYAEYLIKLGHDIPKEKGGDLNWFLTTGRLDSPPPPPKPLTPEEKNAILAFNEKLKNDEKVREEIKKKEAELIKKQAEEEKKKNDREELFREFKARMERQAAKEERIKEYWAALDTCTEKDVIKEHTIRKSIFGNWGAYADGVDGDIVFSRTKSPQEIASDKRSAIMSEIDKMNSETDYIASENPSYDNLKYKIWKEPTLSIWDKFNSYY